jgi:hypothetical protein
LKFLTDYDNVAWFFIYDYNSSIVFHILIP